MNNTPSASSSESASRSGAVAHDEISRRAAELWKQYGEPAGRDEEIWLEAERQLIGSSGSAIDPAGASARAQAGDASAPQANEIAAPAEPQASTPAFTESSSQAVARSGGRGSKARRDSGR